VEVARFAFFLNPRPFSLATFNALFQAWVTLPVRRAEVSLLVGGL